MVWFVAVRFMEAALGTFPGGCAFLPGPLFFWGGALGRGHSRSLVNTTREADTHSSKRLLNWSQWTKNSSLFSGVSAKSLDLFRRA
jgi:hypothetical protein